MNQKTVFFGTLIVVILLLIGAAVGVPKAFGSTKSLSSFSAEEASAYRWQAMADYYTRLTATDLTTLSAGEISAYRWQAMAEYYSKLGAGDLTTRSAEEISAYRWKAMAEYYSTSGLLRQR